MVLLRHQHIKMDRNNVWFYIFALTLLEAAVKTKMNVEEKSHVMQESLLDGVNVGFQELGTNAIPNEEELAETMEEGILHFEPPNLQFGTHYLGSPHSERVVLYNRGNETLQLTSVSGNTPHFHSSFFENKVILPKGNTSFSVVFLGREMGAVSAHLFIHTSKGIQKYPVSGESLNSLYRLQPLVGVRLPHNASFSPLIYLHNPHDHPIQITEVYSSGGGLSLELPGGCREGPQALWYVPPHSTRPVVGVAYRAQASHPAHSPPHSAYIRIKINSTNTVLVVAVEVQNSAEPGPYTVPHLLDLGMAGTKDPPKQFRIHMGNSQSRWVRVGSASVRAARAAGRQPAVARGVTVTLVKLPLVPPHSTQQHVATLTVDWREMFAAGQCCGEVILKTKQHRLVIPYVSQPMLGGLLYNATRFSFLLSENDVNKERDFVIQNGFNTGIFITDIELGGNMDLYFKTLDFQPIAVRPFQNVTLFRLGLEAWGRGIRFESKIKIVTNITSYEVPVYIYDGKFDVTVSTPNPRFEKEFINLGLVGTSSTSRATIWLTNNNPLPICVQNWGVNMEGGAMQFLGCLENPEDDDNITACTCIGAGIRGAASLSAVAPAREGIVEGRAFLTTSHHTLTWRVTLQAARGRLALASILHLTHCFAGTICSQPLRITSSFPFNMSMSHMTTVPKDQRLYYSWEGLKDNEKYILPRQTSTVGHIYYDPYRNCNGVCYTGLDLNTTVGNEWLLRMSLPMNTSLTDAAMANHSYELYRNLTTSSSNINYTLKLDTTEVYGHTMQARVTLSWPRLSSVQLVSFPLARVGGSSQATLTLHNPSRHQSVLLQLVPAWSMDGGEDIQHLHQGFHPVDCDPDWSCVRAPPKTFTLYSLNNSKSNSDRESYEAPSLLSVHRHTATKVFLLLPEASVNVTIEFNASQAATLTSLLYIRNNLTILEVVRLTGQGVYPSFKFGNRKPGSATPLLFELTEKHLKDCDKNRAIKLLTPPNLTVKRSFTARNTGEIPISVTTFFVNGYECEGYGFKVMNCYPFVLFPNGTHKIDVAFTPDFTLARVKRTLIIITSLGTPVNYTLLTTVPSHLLEPCSKVLDRPVWEPILRNITVVFMCCISVFVLIAGFFESDRILRMAMAAMTRDRTAVHSPLDLRSIGHTSQSNGVVPKNDTVIKKWDQNVDVKVPQDMQDENRRFSTEDIKLKCDVNIHQQKSKKKLGKQCSHGMDSGTSEIVSETESISKEKKMENSNVWTSIFSRNGRISKSESPKNLPEQSDTAKPLTPSEIGSTEHAQCTMLDIPKKIFSNLYSVSTDSTPKSHNHVVTHNTKSHRKSKYHCEEDTSSTATESSNNEEIDKDNESSPPSEKSGSSSGSKKNIEKTGKNQCPAFYRDSYEGDGEDEEYDKLTKQNYPNSNTTSNQKYLKTKNTTKVVEQKSDLSSERAKIIPEPIKISYDKLTQYENSNSNNKQIYNNIDLRVNKNQTKNTNGKNEKMVLSKKRSLDKSFVFGATKITETIPNQQLNETTNQQGSQQGLNVNNCQSNSNIDTSLSLNNIARASPPMSVSSSSWENKAKFSDVVARSENSSYSSIVAPRKIGDLKFNTMKGTQTSIPVNKLFNSNVNCNANNDKMRQTLDKSPLGQLDTGYYQYNTPNTTPWESAYDTSKFSQKPAIARNFPISTQIQDEIVIAPHRTKSLFHFGNGAQIIQQNSNKEKMQKKSEVGVIGQTKQKPVAQIPNIPQSPTLTSYRNASAPTSMTGYGIGVNYGGSPINSNDMALYDERVADKMNAVTFGESGGKNAMSSIRSSPETPFFRDYAGKMAPFNDCGSQGWGQNTGGVWDPPTTTGSSPTKTPTTNTKKSAAEWLWGYNSGHRSLTPPPGFETMLPPPPLGLETLQPLPPLGFETLQPPSPLTTQNISGYDPFSISAIWAAPAPTLDPAPALGQASVPWHNGTERPNQ